MNVEGDYAILEKVRDTCSDGQQMAFLAALRGIWHSRYRKRLKTPHENSKIGDWFTNEYHLFYEPGDYQKAAEEAGEQEGKKHG